MSQSGFMTGKKRKLLVKDEKIEAFREKMRRIEADEERKQISEMRWVIFKWLSIISARTSSIPIRNFALLFRGVLEGR